MVTVQLLGTFIIFSSLARNARKGEGKWMKIAENFMRDLNYFLYFLDSLRLDSFTQVLENMKGEGDGGKNLTFSFWFNTKE